MDFRAKLEWIKVLRSNSVSTIIIQIDFKIPFVNNKFHLKLDLHMETQILASHLSIF